jgi:hypothetical protein
MQGICSNNLPTTDRHDIWEIGYNHFHNRAGIALPNTKKLITEQIRPWALETTWNQACETLTHTDLPSINAPNRAAKTNSTSRLR